MKTNLLYITLLLTLFQTVNAQVILGNENKVSSESVLIEFPSENNTKGIILPHVSTLDTKSVAGTMFFDVNDNIIKVKLADKWQELTENENTFETTINTSSESGEGVIIGNNISNVPPGVLVLSAEDKAMVLPKIANPTENVKGPYAGMICYDTVSKSLAIFDGDYWHYWN